MNPASWPQWATLCAQLGFPVLVAGYLLIRFDGLLRALITAEATESTLLTALKDAVTGLTAAVDRANARR